MPFPDIDPVLIEIGPLAIRWYALAYVFGIGLGVVYMARMARNPYIWRRNTPPFTDIHVHDFLLWAMLGIILGGRLFYVLFYNLPYYAANPLSALMIWQGGMSFHGGLAGVILATLLFVRRNNLPLLSFGDAVAAATPIGLFLGRIANFINGELWGRPTDAPWGVIFPRAGDMPRHPSQLYEAFLEGVVIFLILRIMTHNAQSLHAPGFTGGMFLILYGLARIFVEFFREPDQQLGFLIGGLTMGMALSIPLILAGAGVCAYALKQRDVRA